MTTVETGLLTVEDLLRLGSAGVRGELIPGVLCETMPPGHSPGAIVMTLGGELRNCVKPRKLGWPAGSDSDVWLERHPDTVRESSAGDAPPEANAPGRPIVSPGGE